MILCLNSDNSETIYLELEQGGITVFGHKYDSLIRMMKEMALESLKVLGTPLFYQTENSHRKIDHETCF